MAPRHVECWAYGDVLQPITWFSSLRTTVPGFRCRNLCSAMEVAEPLAGDCLDALLVFGAPATFYAVTSVEHTRCLSDRFVQVKEDHALVVGHQPQVIREIGLEWTL